MHAQSRVDETGNQAMRLLTRWFGREEGLISRDDEARKAKKSTLAEAVMKRLNLSNINALSASDRKIAIQMTLMELEDANPDDPVLIADIENRVTRILWRFKNLTGLDDSQIAEIIGKSRPTVQAYMSGRLRENLSAEACRKLLKMIEVKRAEIDVLERDLRRAAVHSNT